MGVLQAVRPDAGLKKLPKDLSVIAKLSILIKLEGKDGCITSKATRCRIKKVAQMFPNFGYKVTTSFSH